MGFEGLSSSVVIALAAVLWLAYLVPTWFRRREYLSTERNTVRLQQTLRILAETAEMPEQVRVENSARSVAEQEKVMHREMQRTRAIERAQQAAEARAAARRLAESKPALAAHVARTSASSRRLRRSRLVSTLVLVAAMVGVVAGVVQAAAGAGVVLLVASVVVGAGAVVLLGQLAAVSKARKQLAAEVEQTTSVSTPVQDLWEHPVEKPRASTGWTPQPIPKPLYLSRSEAPASPHVSFADAAARLARPADAAAELKAASAEAEQSLREAQSQVPRVSPPTEPAETTQPRVEPAAQVEPVATKPAPSRFASMGILDDADLAPADINEALRRRRAV
ncbi:hypothetical protein OH146_10870 [Salinibacterium sp. SYSU T00001]|uniref:DUF3040 domain-containing protein n=1 Tax=Homoserinimonas sedimenticola TaxID=2986805 RepID=UPI0022366D60|nr:DUF3040 domain-containing protein [Salinibacterium sedimenticola]MCW4386274.1 hypothetical protein [Salinibacterium sedimenticola]